MLSTQLLPPGADLGEIARVGMAAAEQVIGETFFIAMAVVALAVFPIWRFRSLDQKATLETPDREVQTKENNDV